MWGLIAYMSDLVAGTCSEIPDARVQTRTEAASCDCRANIQCLRTGHHITIYRFMYLTWTQRRSSPVLYPLDRSAVPNRFLYCSSQCRTMEPISSIDIGMAPTCRCFVVWQIERFGMVGEPWWASAIGDLSIYSRFENVLSYFKGLILI